jgi:plasmid stability protein
MDSERQVGLPPELYERIAKAAARHQRSIRGEVRYALGLYLDSQERRNGQPPIKEATA